MLRRTRDTQHVGIRSAINDWDRYDDDYELGFVISHAEDIEEVGWQGIVKKNRDTVRNNPVYSEFSVALRPLGRYRK